MTDGKLLGRAAARGDRCHHRTRDCCDHQRQRRREDRQWRREAARELGDAW